MSIDLVSIDDINNESFQEKLGSDIASEIERVESDLNDLKNFYSVIIGNGGQKRQNTSRRKVTRGKVKPKLTKSGKKIGRPTNAEKLAREDLARTTQKEKELLSIP